MRNRWLRDEVGGNGGSGRGVGSVTVAVEGE